MLDSTYQKLKILGDTAKYDTCGPKESVDTKVPGVYYAKTNGGYCRLFKVLQTNVCTKNCRYCINQSTSNTPRAILSPTEMADAFIEVYQKRLVDGLFLSSGIGGKEEQAMTTILDTSTILRNKYHYKGYIHLKVMPKVGTAYLEKAVQLANRVSLNFEAPNKERLSEIAPDKDFEYDVLDTSSRLQQVINNHYLQTNRKVTQTTQFVVGATADNDKEILKSMIALYKKLRLQRIFFSSFEPVKGTKLEDRAPASTIRKHRLYQADWLYRFYGFEEDELLEESSFLSLDKDPKHTWAERHPEQFPIEINSASYHSLLRIPGVGPESAKIIIEKRKENLKITTFNQLQKLRISLKKASPYITVNGKHQNQLSLF